MSGARSVRSLAYCVREPGSVREEHCSRFGRIERRWRPAATRTTRKMAKAKAKAASSKKAATPRAKKTSLHTILATNPCSGADANKTLVEAQDERDQAKAKQRRGASLSTEQKVLKCLRDNFEGFSEEEIYSKTIDGQTLYNRLLADKTLEALDPAGCTVKFGKRYFMKLRSEYGNDGIGEKLSVNDEIVECSPKLIEAVDASRSAQGGRDMLVQWLQTAGLPNQTEMVGLVSHLLELRPRSGGSQFQTCLEALKMMVRTGAVEKHLGEFECFKKQADRTLCVAYGTMKSKGFSLQNFWAAYRKLGATVMNATIVDSLMSVKSSWADHQGDLSAVAKCELGEAMFSFAIVATASVSAGDRLQETVTAKFANIAHIKADYLQAKRKEILEEIEKLPNRASLNVPRIVDMWYRGRLIKVKVKSIIDEANLRVDLELRNLAINSPAGPDGKMALTPLFCELALVPVVPKMVVIDEECLSQANAARMCANESLSCELHEDGTQVIQSLTDNEAVYDMIDPSFRLEVGWFASMHSVGAKEILEQKVLAEMPTAEGGPAKATEVSAKIASLKGTPLYRFCGSEPQSSVNIANSWVEAVANMRQPSLVGSDGPFLQQVAERLQYFLVCEGEEGQPTLRGKLAVAPLLSRAQNNSAMLSPDAVKLFSVFSWLLTDEQRTQVQALISNMVRSGGGSGATASAASSSAFAPPAPRPAANVVKKRGGGKPAKEGASDSTLALFKKKRRTTTT